MKTVIMSLSSHIRPGLLPCIFRCCHETPSLMYFVGEGTRGSPDGPAPCVLLPWKQPEGGFESQRDGVALMTPENLLWLPSSLQKNAVSKLLSGLSPPLLSTPSPPLSGPPPTPLQALLLPLGLGMSHLFQPITCHLRNPHALHFGGSTPHQPPAHSQGQFHRHKLSWKEAPAPRPPSLSCHLALPRAPRTPPQCRRSLSGAHTRLREGRTASRAPPLSCQEP